MKKNNGFTLVELLAVIVVIALIMVIVVPNVVKNLNTAKKKTFLLMADKVRSKAVETNELAKFNDENNNGVYVYDLEDLGMTSTENYAGYVIVDNTDIENPKYTMFLKNDDYEIYNSDVTSNTPQIDEYEENGYFTSNVASDNVYFENKCLICKSYSTGKCLDEDGNDISSECSIPTGTVTPVSFATDSWKTIVAAFRSGDYVGKYNVGDTKTVDMGSLGTHTLRLANTTSCSSEESETGCGFVIEFADVITTGKMYTTGSNVGGWNNCILRKYVNDTVYNSLPNDLKSLIISIKVISGHGIKETSNFISSDKLYLLSSTEVYGKASSDSAINTTRQLDYYKSLGVTNSNYSGAIKNRNGSSYPWWLRSIYSPYEEVFDDVTDIGVVNYGWASNTNGVSPAFRIA